MTAATGFSGECLKQTSSIGTPIREMPTKEYHTSTLLTHKLRKCTRARAHTQAYTHTHTRTHTHTHTHMSTLRTEKHRHAHLHQHTQIRTPTLKPICNVLIFVTGISPRRSGSPQKAPREPTPAHVLVHTVLEERDQQLRWSCAQHLWHKTGLYANE